MRSEITKITKRLKEGRGGLKEILSIMEMVLEDRQREKELLFPHEVFEGLNELIGRTLRGARINHSRPHKKQEPFHTFELHTEEGEVLGYLNTIYLRDPIPCYYLVYVEVLTPFRGRGLGGRILRSFREFVQGKGAIGLLDNIIPPEEPTYEIYSKSGFREVVEIIGPSRIRGEGNYMVFIPSSLEINGVREKLKRLLFRIEKKRPVVQMHENESMVKRTISEFKAVYETLKNLFEIELLSGPETPFMCFIFTKFVTKLLGFKRRIMDLIGYTGGESLEQFVISDRIKALPLLSYSLWSAKEEGPEIWGDEKIIKSLSEELKRDPTLFIEKLPLYRRPYLTTWAERRGGWDFSNLRIAHLLEIGFDPTRLREFKLQGLEYIFERVSPYFLSSLERKGEIFKKIVEEGQALRFNNTSIQINPPLMIIRDKGNIYILRRKVEGIHMEEALDQLRGAPHLKEMNREVGIDRRIIITVNQIKDWLLRRVERGLWEEVKELAFFVPWDLEKNIPKLHIDLTKVYMDRVWVA